MHTPGKNGFMNNDCNKTATDLKPYSNQTATMIQDEEAGQQSKCAWIKRAGMVFGFAAVVGPLIFAVWEVSQYEAIQEQQSTSLRGMTTQLAALNGWVQELSKSVDSIEGGVTNSLEAQDQRMDNLETHVDNSLSGITARVNAIESQLANLGSNPIG